jgi:hypothetical protein
VEKVYMTGMADDPSGFLDAVTFVPVVLPGIGQVMFQDHAGTGLLFLAGIAIASPFIAAGALMGAIIGPVPLPCQDVVVWPQLLSPTSWAYPRGI